MKFYQIIETNDEEKFRALVQLLTNESIQFRTLNDYIFDPEQDFYRLVPLPRVNGAIIEVAKKDANRTIDVLERAGHADLLAASHIGPDIIQFLRKFTSRIPVLNWLPSKFRVLGLVMAVVVAFFWFMGYLIVNN